MIHAAYKDFWDVRRNQLFMKQYPIRDIAYLEHGLLVREAG